MSIPNIRETAVPPNQGQLGRRLSGTSPSATPSGLSFPSSQLSSSQGQEQSGRLEHTNLLN